MTACGNKALPLADPANFDGKNGKPLGFRSSIALEAQDWPDAVNNPNFPSIVLQPGETYHSITVYRFGICK